MRKRVYNIFVIMVLLICSMSLVFCKAITAQNISSNPGMNGGPKMNGNPGMGGGPGMNGNTRGNGTTSL